MRISDWANADEPTKRKLAEEALAKSQFLPAREWPQSMPPSEAKAALIAAFPKFDWGNFKLDWGEPVAPGGRLAHLKGIQGSCTLSLTVSREGYRFQLSGEGIGLLLESSEPSPTLADAIAALRQAKAEHLRALELLG